MTGKGDKWRKTNYAKYWGSPLWDNLSKNKSDKDDKTEKPAPRPSTPATKQPK